MGLCVKWGVLVAIVAWVIPIKAIWAGDLSYPKAKREALTDTYHKVVVSDPYRWLEYVHSPEVVDWLDQENKITNLYLNNTLQWLAIAKRLAVLTKEQSKEYKELRHVGGRSFVLYKDPAKYQSPV